MKFKAMIKRWVCSAATLPFTNHSHFESRVAVGTVFNTLDSAQHWYQPRRKKFIELQIDSLACTLRLGHV